jgi:8-oxo-dGTP pyrophosphatase MutT (NUDIX family)
LLIGVDGAGLATERLVSAGGVIYRVVDGKLEVALIRVGEVWGLPKGLIEEHESLEAAALREVAEETGLAGELIGKIGEINYSFVRDKRYFKTVHFFLFRCVGGSVEAHDSEVDEVRWFSFSEAMEALAYPNERKMLVEAERMLKGLAGFLV